METLAGDNDLEVRASGGVPESVVGTLATLPYLIRVSPRIEDYAVIAETKKSLPLIGLDLVAEGSAYAQRDSEKTGAPQIEGGSENVLEHLGDADSIWVGSSAGYKTDDHVELLINDRVRNYTVRGVYPDSNGNESAIVMDLAAAQQALARYGRVDRILLKVRETPSLEDWQQRLRGMLPAGVEVRPQGTGTNENRRMLAAFRWNLRVLSYISLVVGAFLIYNTIAVSVVRRRPEIGVLRALGASRRWLLWLFLGEALMFGLVGSLIGIALGRLMAQGAVGLIATTVNSLYVTSRPTPVALNAPAVIAAILAGVIVALFSALAPAREAMRVAPTEAMGRGEREHHARLHSRTNLIWAAVLAVIAASISRAGPIDGKPLAGYAATLLAIASMRLAVPALVLGVTAATKAVSRRCFGPAGMLGVRSLAASLSRTSVIVAALATAVAMMASVGIMVGSFRETVALWLDTQLRADLYIRPAGPAGASEHPALPLELLPSVASIDGVEAVDDFHAFEFDYQGQRATLGGGNAGIVRRYGRLRFLPGEDRDAILRSLPDNDRVIVSEPFANKHAIRAGDELTLSLGDQLVKVKVAGIYYDYSSERGFVIFDRSTLLRYLPGQPATNLAVYLKKGSYAARVQHAVEQQAARYHGLVAPNRLLRQNA